MCVCLIFCKGKFRPRLPPHPICVPSKAPPQLRSPIASCQSSLEQQGGRWQQEREAAEGAAGRGCAPDSVVVEGVGVESRPPPRTLAPRARAAPRAADVIACSRGKRGRQIALTEAHLDDRGRDRAMKTNTGGSYSRPGSPRRCHPVRFSAGCS